MERPELLLRRARLHRSRLDLEGAANILKEAVVELPDDVRLWRDLARLAAMTSDEATLKQSQAAIERLAPPRQSRSSHEVQR